MTTKLDLGELYRVRLNREREKRKLASEKGNMPKEPEFSAAKHRKLAQGSSSTGDRDGDRETATTTATMMAMAPARRDHDDGDCDNELKRHDGDRS